MPETIDDIVRDHYDRVYRLALSLSGRPADADDIAQEVFVAVIRGLPQFRGDAKVSTWIYRIAIRAAMRWRARHPHQETLPESLTANDQTVPLDLINAINALPVTSRIVISLVSVEGLTHAEAGEVLGVAEGTVSSRLHTARKQLAARLNR